jgi:hypothetical protein
MSVKMDVNNYELFALDYMEGRLQGDLLHDFEIFLANHPDIALEIQLLSEDPVSLDPSLFALSSDSSDLKVKLVEVGPINSSNYEHYFAHAASGVLTELEIKDVHRFVALNERIAKDFALYQLTTLKPPIAVYAANKNDLKKPIPIWELVYFETKAIYRVSALLLLALGAWSALQLLNKPTYAPRTSGADFLEISPDLPEINFVESSTTTEPAVDAVEAPKLLSSAKVELVVEAAESDSVSVLKHREVALVHPEFKETEVVMEATPREDIASLAMVQKAEELTVIQYLGKRFLNLDPQSGASTKEILRQSAEKALAKTDRFSYQDTEREDKNSVQILAGAFEFRKVTYKEN